MANVVVVTSGKGGVGKTTSTGVPGARQLRRCAVAPVVAHQAQGQATQGRDLSTLAPLWALRARTPGPAWTRRAVGEGVKFCPRAGCGRAACPVYSRRRTGAGGTDYRRRGL